MKIGICGPQSSGKSTLARALAERLGLPLIQEQARFVAREMGAFSEEMLRRNVEIAQEFQRRCLRRQIEAEAEHPGGFVSDRTTLDNAAYWLAWNHARANVEERCAYLWRARDHARRYDLLIYCPPIQGLEPEDDGFRITDPVYQAEIDMLIRTLLLGWEIPSWVWVEGSTQKRLEQALTALEEVGERRIHPHDLRAIVGQDGRIAGFVCRRCNRVAWFRGKASNVANRSGCAEGEVDVIRQLGESCEGAEVDEGG